MVGNKWENHCQTLTSCALAGAAAFFAGIPDAYIIANGPSWCYFYALRKAGQPGQKLEYRFFSTYPDNKSVIFGTENKLLETLKIVNRMPQKPSVLLIENSCAISLIGDDIAGIAASTDPEFPVVTFDSGGLVGGHWEGYRKAALSYFETIPPDDDVESEPRAVNIIGSDPTYFCENYDIREIRRLLSMIGVRVHAVVGNGATVEAMKKLKKASLNIVLHQECGLELAEYLYEEHGMEYVSLLPPYGLKGSLRWLERIAECLKLAPSACDSVKREANKTEEHLYLHTRDAQKIWGEPWYDVTILSAPSSVVDGISNVLRDEWVDTAEVFLFTHDEPAEQKHGMSLFTNGEKLRKALLNSSGLLLASGHERKLLDETNPRAWQMITIANPDPMSVVLSDRPLMGINGAKVFTEMIWENYIRRKVEC